MADTISLETLKQLAEQGYEGIAKIVEELLKSGESAISYAKALEKADDATKFLLKQTVALQEGVQGVAKSYETAAGKSDDMMSRLSRQMGDFIGTLNGVKAAEFLEPLIKIIPETITGMGELGKAAKEAGEAGGAMMSELAKSPAISALKMLKLPVEYTTAVSGLNATYNAMNNEIIKMAAGQGNFNSVLLDSTGMFKEMNDLYVGTIAQAKEQADATGNSISKIMEMRKALSSIPKALDEGISVGASKVVDQISAASMTAAAFGQDQSKVISDLTSMYNKFGISGDDAFKSLTNIYEKAGDSRLRFEGFSSSVMAVAEKFKMLGDNTLSATNLVKSFDNAFRDSKLSPEAMTEVINRMASGIEKMDLAKLSFVSSQTGGPGGLAGGIQMEQALAEGRIDEVLRRTMEAMQAQFGGPVVTRKEAAETPELAGEYYKQVQYLTEVAGIAGSRQEAAQILEAMKTGVIDKLKLGEGETGTKSLETAISRGNNYQEQTTDKVAHIAYTTAEMFKLMQASDVGRTLVGKANEFVNELSPGYMSDATGRVKSAGKITSTEEIATEQMLRGGFTADVWKQFRDFGGKSKEEKEPAKIAPETVMTEATRQVVSTRSAAPLAEPQTVRIAIDPIPITIDALGKEINLLVEAKIKNEQNAQFIKSQTGAVK